MLDTLRDGGAAVVEGTLGPTALPIGFDGRLLPDPEPPECAEDGAPYAREPKLGACVRKPEERPRVLEWAGGGLRFVRDVCDRTPADPPQYLPFESLLAVPDDLPWGTFTAALAAQRRWLAPPVSLTPITEGEVRAICHARRARAGTIRHVLNTLRGPPTGVCNLRQPATPPRHYRSGWLAEQLESGYAPVVDPVVVVVGPPEPAPGDPWTSWRGTVTLVNTTNPRQRCEVAVFVGGVPGPEVARGGPAYLDRLRAEVDARLAETPRR